MEVDCQIPHHPSSNTPSATDLKEPLRNSPSDLPTSTTFPSTRDLYRRNRSDTSEAINNLSALHDEHAVAFGCGGGLGVREAFRDRAGAAESDRLRPDASAFAQPGHGAARIRVDAGLQPTQLFWVWLPVLPHSLIDPNPPGISFEHLLIGTR